MSSLYTPIVRTARPEWVLAIVIVTAFLALSGLLSSGRPVDDLATVPSFSRLPLSFVTNHGQAVQEVRFVVHGASASMFFTPGSVGLTSPESMAQLVFQGASPAVDLQGAKALPGVANYYLGNDPAQWRTGLPTYGGVVYRQLYPGIDLSYEGTAGSLKGTYTIAAGADPAVIRWSYQGAMGINLDGATGNLLVSLPTTATEAGRLQAKDAALIPATLVESAPIAWQTNAGRRAPVEVRYVLYEGPVPAVGFAVGAYDPAAPLTIDPTLVYSTYLGGGSSDDGGGIALDSQGNAYLTGETYSSDFPGATNSRSQNSDAFVTRLNAAGNAVVYTTYLGGEGWDYGNGVAVDNAGNAYVTGLADSADFPVKNAAQPSYGYNGDAFISKLTASGALSYSTYVGDIEHDFGTAIAVNGSTGDAYITGASNNDVLAARLNAAGAFVYAGAFGGHSEDYGRGIAVDSSGKAYIAGETSSYDFPIYGQLQFCDRASSVTAGYCHDAFVSVLNADATQFVFSTFLGGSSGDDAQGIALDSQSNVYIAGSTVSQDFPTANPYQASCAGSGDGCADAFVTKIKSDFSGLAYSTYMGGASGVALGKGIAVDAGQNAYVVGTTSSPNFPVTGNAPQSTFGGGYCGSYPTRYCYDTFVVKLSPAGNSRVYSTYLGGGSDDQGRGIAADSSGAAYVTGVTESSNFPTVNPLHAYRPPRDAFVTKISGASAPVPTPTATRTPVHGLNPRVFLPLVVKN